MNPEPDSRLTFRCSICAVNWPFYQPFEECPVCEEKCSAIRLSSTNEILTLEQANEILKDHGIKVVPRPRRQITEQAMIRRLHDQLSDWAREAPEWMR